MIQAMQVRLLVLYTPSIYTKRMLHLLSHFVYRVVQHQPNILARFIFIVSISAYQTSFLLFFYIYIM